MLERLRYSWHIASAVQFAAAAVRRLEQVVSRRPLPLREYRNFLLLQHPLPLGNAIHATPLIRALHAAIPGARVEAVASGFALEILRGNPGLERVIETPSPLKDFRGAVRAMRQAKPFSGEPYVALQTLGNERTLVTAAAMLSGGSVRVGHSVLPELVSAALSQDHRVSLIANNLRIVEVLGHGHELLQALEQDPSLIEPQVFPGEDDVARARALLVEQGIALDRPMALFVTQTSPTQRKSWRAERFQAVAEWLHAKHGMQLVFVGARSEAAAIEGIRAGLSFPSASLAGRTSLLELSAAMGFSDVALTLDTGPMHLLRAMQVPMAIIAPAWSPPVEWLPLGNPRVRIFKNADMDHAPDDYVIDEVQVEEVEAALDELLHLYPVRQKS